MRKCEFCNKGEMVLIQDRFGIKGTDDKVGWKNKVWKCCNCKSQIREEIYDETQQQQDLLNEVIHLLKNLTKDSHQTLQNHINHHYSYKRKRIVKCWW